jgi:hypothetical protein
MWRKNHMFIGADIADLIAAIAAASQQAEKEAARFLQSARPVAHNTLGHDGFGHGAAHGARERRLDVWAVDLFMGLAALANTNTPTPTRHVLSLGLRRR